MINPCPLLAPSKHFLIHFRIILFNLSVGLWPRYCSEPGLNSEPGTVLSSQTTIQLLLIVIYQCPWYYELSDGVSPYERLDPFVSY